MPSLLPDYELSSQSVGRFQTPDRRRQIGQRISAVIAIIRPWSPIIERSVHILAKAAKQTMACED